MTETRRLAQLLASRLRAVWGAAAEGAEEIQLRRVAGYMFGYMKQQAPKGVPETLTDRKRSVTSAASPSAAVTRRRCRPR
jgi:hypothetical protein